MNLQIIKPTKTGKASVTLTTSGVLYFNTRAVNELNLMDQAGAIPAKDSEGRLYLKFSEQIGADAFRIRISKNKNRSSVYIWIMPLIRLWEMEVKKSTRHNLIKSEDSFYLLDGLKIKPI